MEPLTGIQKPKKNFDCFSFETSVKFAHYISFASNIILFLTLMVSEIKYKPIGVLFHLGWGGLLFYIIKIMNNYTVSQLKNLKLYYKILFVIILNILIFYTCSLVELKKTEADQQFAIFFIFCFVILMFFHVIFGVIIYRYILYLIDKPKQKDNKVFVDKNLNDLIAKSSESILIS